MKPAKPEATKNSTRIHGIWFRLTVPNTYVFILPGITLGFAVNSGRMAGRNAAEHIKSIS